MPSSGHILVRKKTELKQVGGEINDTQETKIHSERALHVQVTFAINRNAPGVLDGLHGAATPASRGCSSWHVDRLGDQRVRLTTS